ncbi:UDP-3-O-(3-hydroxymyristoyl)glucosamine N-acyltransferase [Pseudidiomarina tainanensis]|jgi:UDP-3-O-[3-hydroxymyristoyl] glucosamine N-acyltransferase|uniref:UDP-3-O-acylglucosamine N-acyltransferase n=2 Tax=Pseudidiomarina TaxID=2800384 RepID=A0A1I6GGE4_9GAMM|nr:MULTISPECIES: UDP-3-O-(3-hydroxymyristoyl)glucosamine N-acyltransferase [Pseudidiomarina]RZQ56686.1 UDP-3-O-(3-hydroxymyristoyl)glucosamine N-acyltransferase [Pseudidiomarina tainanensis]SFR41249.1 UDP-3-O-[3-hydroxymyristoyl] glucosamine N-acyltransferase [Pseudidiomarina maritima]
MQTLTLQQLADAIGAQVQGDAALTVTGVATLASAQPGQIAFLANEKYRSQLDTSKASAVIVAPNIEVPAGMSVLCTSNPYAGFAKVAQLLDTTPKAAESIHASAQIHPSAKIGKNVAIGANAVIAENVELADNVTIGVGCYVGPGTRIGAHTQLWQHVVIYHNCVIGEHCLVHAGSVIGADGFGWANEGGKWIKIPQLGRVVIGNRVDIGASTTIDRGALDDTVISNGVIIDNQCQIAHNVFIDEDTAIAGCTVLAGSCRIGKRCLIGGATAINGHISICDDVQISGFSMVIKEITEPGAYASGIPAAPQREWRRNGARYRQLDDLFQRVKKIEKQLEQ